MFQKNLTLLLLVFFAAISPMAAQVTPTQKKDTIKKDVKMYQNIQDYSKKNKFMKFMHKLIFRPVEKQSPSGTRKKTKDLTPEMKVNYTNYEGKVIRNIKIVTLDPFGYSINDTTREPKKWIERAGNDIHLKTKQSTIRNLLLFKKNKPLDSLLVEESERLIRTQRYVRRVVIRPVAISEASDSVDVEIRVLDSWSLIPNGSISSSRTSLELTERNFFGLGHEFRNEFDHNLNDSQRAYLGQYTIPNIKNTYISASATYQVTMEENTLKSFGLERQFFSAYTRWAGGAYAEERLVRDSLPNAENIYAMQNMKSNSADLWGGYSFKIFRGFTEEDRTTNLVTTGRYYIRNYREAPSIEYDSVGYYTGERLYLASIGLTSRKFVQDKYLFNYDIVEDIPIGRVYSITGGMQDKNNQHRAYLGGRYSFGNYYKWGYFSINAEVGSFFYKGISEQTTLRFDALYFTNIKQWGPWRFRHFIQPELVFGDNRMAIITDQLNINNENGIPGFDSSTLMGTKKFLLSLQTQAYSPWDLLGFRLNPFFNFTMGVLADEDNNLYQNKVYSSFSLGFLISNDFLVFNSFQLSFSYYPSIPGNGQNVMQSNSVKNDNITLPDFQIGKPVIVPYQ